MGVRTKGFLTTKRAKLGMLQSKYFNCKVAANSKICVKGIRQPSLAGD